MMRVFEKVIYYLVFLVMVVVRMESNSEINWLIGKIIVINVIIKL